ncbi:PqiC family protein [Thiocystis violacea]|uniref:PqiC family protein n=1 Tax=Thiocystis violacea TaxID=13725 RepID=UPI0019083777|nr:PqiC family protein [Thiocystis violacea]MBK1718678.1 hypothetical protein [Thiocystis violacea]
MRSVTGRILAAGLLALLFAGCASTPPSSFHTLAPLSQPEAGAVVGKGDFSLGLGPVTFPVFLDRPQIVSRASANRLAMDEYQRWGGTLQDDFLRVWSENLALLLGTSRILIFPSEIRYPLDFRIAADILAFEGTADGHALLKVRWFVLDAELDRVLSAHETAYRRPLSPPGDAEAQLAALSLALADFSREVAAVLRTLPKPGSEPNQSTANAQSP